MTHKIIIEDSILALQRLPDSSVQLVVTSPPYDKLRSYGGHAWDFEGTARELFRVLVDGGAVCWNVNNSVLDGSEAVTAEKQKIYFHEVCGFNIHQTLIYGKNNFSAADSTRYHKCFEYVYVLSRGKLATFNPIMDKKNKCFGQTTFGRNGKRQVDGSFTERKQVVYGEFGKRPNFWLGNTRGQENPCDPLPHPAMMPKWLAQDLIISYSNPGDTVLDCFAGSGTTGAQALKLHRHTILIDVDPTTLPIIEKTIAGVEPILL